ncbi:type II toxin-antitoxin system HipA family toxin [Haliscomenobacter sp.]|uniref:type II toxin-antitoxin system HipA family toxin n=1 Tax=Haliscomenobacter sp. TaxID=2717303 RepID=UPI003BAB28EA
MSTNKTDIWVYAHWQGMKTPKMVGILSAHQAKGKKAFSFEYARDWVQSKEQLLLDPDIGWFSGPQFPNSKENFGVFLDSMPDRWGRTLMKRRAAQLAKEAGKPTPTLYDIDFLLGVQDESRMGALRFKTDPDGPFLSDAAQYPIPPISSIRELQQAAQIIESDTENKEIKKWLAILVAPGSSLGGARPKANVRDEQGHAWIAKFPSQHDEVDKGAWEFLLYKLALGAGIVMAESRMMKVNGKYHTFLTKRFDRMQGERIHFASAMTMTGNNEETLKTYTPSYLDLAEFIRFSGANITADLHQLWRRIVFHIAVSNADDHLRNHGFLLSSSGWSLSPAYDLNPSTDKDGLALNIDMDNNALDFELAISVGQYFQLTLPEMKVILEQVKSVVSNWRKVATQIGIAKQEQNLMEAAFRW